MSLIEIYTDGSSRGNPGPGGFGVVMSYKGNEKEISQGFRKTTNNRMELLAVIVAIESLKTPKIPVKVYSDSKYVIDSITKGWLDSWIVKRFKGKKNQDLWMRLDELSKFHNVNWKWVKGHAGNTFNERCDALVHEAIDAGKFIEDSGYLAQQAQDPELFG